MMARGRQKVRAVLAGMTARVPRPVRDVVEAASRDRVAALAAEVAFFAVLSLFPGLLIAVGLVGYLDRHVGSDVAARLEQETVALIDSLLTERAAPVGASVRGLFDGQYGGLLTFSAVGGLVTLSGAWAMLISALNLAYDVTEQRSWVRRRLVGLLLAIATLLVVTTTLAVVVLGPLLGQGSDLASSVGLESIYSHGWAILRYPVMLVVVAGWLTVVLRVAPNRRTTWRAAVPGAMFTAVLWLVSTAGFHLYLSVIGDDNALLGAFGGGVIVMSWAYLLSLALLLGGELNAVLEARRSATLAATVASSMRGSRANSSGSS